MDMEFEQRGKFMERKGHLNTGSERVLILRLYNEEKSVGKCDIYRTNFHKVKEKNTYITNLCK